LELVGLRGRNQSDVAREEEVAAGARQAREHEVLPERLKSLPVVARLLAELPARGRRRRLPRPDESPRQRGRHVARPVLVLAREEDLPPRGDRHGHREVPELHEVHIGRQPPVGQPAPVAPDGEKARPERPARLDRLPPSDAVCAHQRLRPCPMKASTSSVRRPPDRNGAIDRSTLSRTRWRSLAGSARSAWPIRPAPASIASQYDSNDSNARLCRSAVTDTSRKPACVRSAWSRSISPRAEGW